MSIHLPQLPTEMNFDPNLPALVYTELINFGRSRKRTEARHCVMCGRTTGIDCVIPAQNKGAGDAGVCGQSRR